MFAAGIPNLDRAISDGQLKKGDVVMMAAFAHAGDFAGAAVVRWGGRVGDSETGADGTADVGHRRAGPARPPRPGRHGRRQGARVVVVCRPHNPTGTVEPAADIERFLRQVPTDMVVLVDRAYGGIPVAGTSDRRAGPRRAVSQCRSVADVLEGLWAGRSSGRLRLLRADLARRLWTMQLPFGIGITGMVAVAASYDAENELRQRIRMISAEWRYLRMRLRSMGIYSTDSHANFVYLPARGRPWREVFDGTGLQVRNYADGSVRITVGNRQSTGRCCPRWRRMALR